MAEERLDEAGTAKLRGLLAAGDPLGHVTALGHGYSGDPELQTERHRHDVKESVAVAVATFTSLCRVSMDFA
jgi:hypothetical protein